MTAQKHAYLVDGIRTPIAKFAGGLAQVRADDLLALTIEALLERNPSVDHDAIDDVVAGCANQAGEDNRNVARMAALLAKLPVTVPGETINRLCASGMSAVVHAARAIAVGQGELFVAGGVEHMTRAPYVLSKTATAFGRNAELFDTSLGWRFVNPKMQAQYGTHSMGETAENVAERFGIPREPQDRFALSSQLKAKAARERGRLGREIVKVEIPQRKGPARVCDQDEFIRPDTRIEDLSRLRPAFRRDGRGTVTAGNSSGINDGACALLVASDAACQRYGLAPKARLVTSAVAGVEPQVMGLGPIEATKRALSRAELSLADVDVIEINEAFAVQVLACLARLDLEAGDPRVNPNGGAIALGHPLGMSGARLLHTAMLELEEHRKRYALCTMCVGVGQGMATIIERVQ
ncbi:MAG: 3-oxoadipyl-CoA thiolase [Proteobacteria bacterium]|nr:3-oxoadipyl-CoA thiolase [Pseudomonadota bacterium]